MTGCRVWCSARTLEEWWAIWSLKVSSKNAFVEEYHADPTKGPTQGVWSSSLHDYFISLN